MHFTRSTPPHAKKLASFSRSKIYQALFVSALCLGTTSVALADSGVLDPTPFAGMATGAYADGAGKTATGGNVVINEDHGTDDVSGGYAENGASADSNKITIETGAAVGNVDGGYVYGDGNASNNAVTINGGTIEYIVSGGYVDDGEGNAYNNAVTITGGEIKGAVYGGYVYVDGGDGNVYNNTVTISGGTVDGVSGGYSSNGAVYNNTVMITDGDVTDRVSGGDVGGDGNAYNNTVTITGGKVTGDVDGGFVGGDGSANNNTVTVTGGEVTRNVSGGYVNSDGNAYNNTVTVTGGKVTGNVDGGYVDDNGNAYNNTVTVTGGEVTDKVTGGSVSGDGNAYNNTVTVTGGKVTGKVTGGSVDNNGDATGNTVTITGATIENEVYGGYVEYDGDATGNTVNLTNATITGKLFGGDSVSGDAYTGNKLVLTGQNTANTAGGRVKNFEYYQFNDAKLTADVVDLGSGPGQTAKVQINQSGGNLLSVGSELVLIEADLLEGNVADTTSGQGGATMLYDYNVGIVGDQQLVATVTNAKANPRAKALSEGMVGSVAFINQGADLATSRGMDAALSATAGATANAPKVAAFGVAQGGHSRYKTGSNVNVDGASLMLGVGFNLANDLGNFLVAPFVEGGWGNYSSHNSFNNAASVSGGGDSYYFGVGSLFREDFTEGQYGHPYAEASLRVGRSVTKFSSKDLKDFSGVSARYRSENIYYGAHVGGGYILNLQDKATLDTYAKYFYTRQDSDNVTLSTNDKVHFDAVDSNRVRVGTRYNHNLNVDGYDLKPYVGVAFEREFSGKAKASTYGHKIDAPTLRGNTGMLEVGLSFKPQSIQNMSIDFGVEGYTGRREGIVGSLKAYYAF